MEGPQPPDTFWSNGSSFSPDILCGVDLRPAAHWHDYHYSALCPGLRNEAARYRADQRFRMNLCACGLARSLAWLYYARVRFWGHWHYSYTPGFEPRRTVCFYLRLLFGRYLTW